MEIQHATTVPVLVLGMGLLMVVVAAVVCMIVAFIPLGAENHPVVICTQMKVDGWNPILSKVPIKKAPHAEVLDQPMFLQDCRSHDPTIV